MTKQKKDEMLEDKIKTDYRNGDFVSNLLCPKCKKTITNLDLKHWKCVKCGAEFKVDFIKPKKDKTYVWAKNSTGKYKLVWKTE